MGSLTVHQGLHHHRLRRNCGGSPHAGHPVWEATGICLESWQGPACGVNPILEPKWLRIGARTMYSSRFVCCRRIERLVCVILVSVSFQVCRKISVEYSTDRDTHTHARTTPKTPLKGEARKDRPGTTAESRSRFEQQHAGKRHAAPAHPPDRHGRIWIGAHLQDPQKRNQSHERQCLHRALCVNPRRLAPEAEETSDWRNWIRRGAMRPFGHASGSMMHDQVEMRTANQACAKMAMDACALGQSRWSCRGVRSCPCEARQDNPSWVAPGVCF